MRRNIIYFLLLALALSSCGEYNKILKSTDRDLKYSYAKKYFEEGKYSRSITLLEELVPFMKGTAEAEESLYLLAQSHRSEEHTSELQSRPHLVCRLLLEKKKTLNVSIKLHHRYQKQHKLIIFPQLKPHKHNAAQLYLTTVSISHCAIYLLSSTNILIIS